MARFFYALIAAIALFFIALFPAEAASRFWVGGTGTWDAVTTTNWSATSGGAGGASVPGVADTVTFDASSGGGTTTVNTNVNIVALTLTAYTGTLDFSVNNNTVALTGTTTAFIDNNGGGGGGTHALKMGNGTWTVGNGLGSGFTSWDAGNTNMTLTPGGSTLVFSNLNDLTQTQSINWGNRSYNNVTLGQGKYFSSGNGPTVAGTITFGPNSYLTINSANVSFATVATTTTTLGAPAFIGITGSGGQSSIAGGGTWTISNVVIQRIIFSGGGTRICNNCANQGGVTGITMNAPVTGGGSCILGGWLLWRDLPDLHHNNDNDPAWLNKAS